jgi:hypothetical protein
VAATGGFAFLAAGFGRVRRVTLADREGRVRRATRTGRRGLGAGRFRRAAGRALADRLTAFLTERGLGRRRAAFEAFFGAFFRVAGRFLAIFLNLSLGSVDLGR